MYLFVNKITSGVIQTMLVSIIPFIWWLIFARKSGNFFNWLGLKRVIPEKGLNMFFSIVTVAYLVIATGMLLMLDGIITASSEFTGLGIAAFPAVLVYSFLITAFSEELLFRGFLLKCISNRYGFLIGNTIQAVLFSLMHGVMFFRIVGLIQVIIITALTGFIGWFMGYINEKKACGSILPSWGIHGISNLVPSVLALFSIL